MQVDLVRPPISYSGNKYRSLVSGALLPFVTGGDYDVAIDPMMGSGSVAYNMTAKTVMAGDGSQAIFSMHSALQQGEVLNDLANLYFSVFRESPERASPSALLNGPGYYRLRDIENQMSHNGWTYERALALIILSHMSFNSLIRFGPKGFNAPVGMKKFDIEKISLALSRVRRTILLNPQQSNNLERFIFPKTLFYFDPPFITTKYVYDGWDREKEDGLRKLIDGIVAGGADFVLSNAIYYRGKFNADLVDWALSHGYAIHEIANGTYKAWSSAVKSVRVFTGTVEGVITNRRDIV